MYGEGEPLDEFQTLLKEVAAKFPDGRQFACLMSGPDLGWMERLDVLKGLRPGETVVLYLPDVTNDQFLKALRAVEGFECWRSSVHRMAGERGVVFWLRK